jgi:hypothetical protein
MDEKLLIEKATAYLKSHYGEDTVSMDVKKNSVSNGNGELHVDCTVRIGKEESDWTKWFTFSGGEVARMRWQMR